MIDIIKTASIGGNEIDLAYTAWAMVDINRLLRQKDGSSLELPRVILGDAQDNFDLFCEIIEVLVYSAVIYKRLKGQKSDDAISAKEIKYELLPTELIRLKQTAMETILTGLGREEDSEVDLGLAEIEKKSTSEAKTLMCALNLGLKIDDLRILSAGTFYDLIELKFPSNDED